MLGFAGRVVWRIELAEDIDTIIQKLHTVTQVVFDCLSSISGRVCLSKHGPGRKAPLAALKALASTLQKREVDVSQHLRVILQIEAAAPFEVLQLIPGFEYEFRRGMTSAFQAPCVYRLVLW